MRPLLAFLLTLFSFHIFAQVELGSIGYYQDASIFAQSTAPMGTARTQGLGGANVAVGADAFSTVSNPAGLGLIKNGQFNIGLAFNNYGSKSSYINTNSQDSYNYLKLNNISLIIPIEASSNGNYKGGGIGISVIRTNNFQRRFSYLGTNTRSTMADRFTALADGINANIFEAEAGSGEILDLASLSYAGFVINPYLDDSTAYYTEFRDINNSLVAPIRQKETYQTKGGETTFHISYGGNYNDNFFFGFGLGITTLRYSLSSIYNENLTRQAISGELQEFTLKNNRTTRGGGVNFNLGFIARPADFIRFGASFTTPTFYALTEKDENTLIATSRNFNPTTNNTIPSELNFQYTSPLRANAGAAFFFNKAGFFTLEAEWVNYRSMSVNSLDADIQADNKTIKNLYGSAFNLRGGIEGRFDIFRARGGAAYMQNSLKAKPDDINRDIFSFSGGFGLYLKTFSLDLGVTYTPSKSIYTPYSLNNRDLFYSVESKNTQISGIMTVSFLF
ncbi:MAG: hypothetical protein MUC49_11795 [Raineya sp.]|nr:hypothetical protein [Raineya sp.]